MVIILYQKILILLLMKPVAKLQLTQLEVEKLQKSGLKGDLICLYRLYFCLCLSQWFLENAWKLSHVEEIIQVF